MSLEVQPKSKTPEYQSWLDMIKRCTKPTNKDYRHYGARGITVCPAWLDSFEAFIADMGKRPDGRTLDRIDNNGNYEPGNCRWATRAQQRVNQRPLRPDQLMGATQIKKTGRWQAQIGRNGKHFYLGTFATREEAAARYFEALAERA